MLLQYARTVRSNPEATRTATRVYAFAGGYIFVYTLFSLVATIVQRVDAR
jgi:predicted metal-binding membrane protein